MLACLLATTATVTRAADAAGYPTPPPAAAATDAEAMITVCDLAGEALGKIDVRANGDGVLWLAREVLEELGKDSENFKLLVDGRPWTPYHAVPPSATSLMLHQCVPTAPEWLYKKLINEKWSSWAWSQPKVVAQMKDAMERCHWPANDWDDEGDDRSPVVIGAAAWLDLQGVTEGSLYGALTNQNLREYAERLPTAVWTDAVKRLSGPAQLARKCAVVQALLDSKIPRDVHVPRLVKSAYQAKNCLICCGAPINYKDAPELVKLLLRAGILGDDPTFLGTMHRLLLDDVKSLLKYVSDEIPNADVELSAMQTAAAVLQTAKAEALAAREAAPAAAAV